MAKEIELSRGLTAIVDDDDFEWLDQYYWFAQKSGATYYAVGSLSRKPANYSSMAGRRRRPKGQGNIGRLVPMHRFILDAPNDVEVDHINGNGLDNRRSNLRLASRSENLQNRRVFRNSRLGHKAIHFEKKTGRYAVLIRVSFATLEEALRERDRIFRFVYGEHFNEDTTMNVDVSAVEAIDDEARATTRHGQIHDT